MMRFLVTVLAASLTFATACKKQASDGAAGSAAGSAAMAGSAMGSAAGATGSAAAGSAAGSDTGSAAAGMGSAGAGSDSGSAAAAGSGSAASEGMAHRAGRCPSTVLGSTTTSAVKGKAVVVTIHAADPDAIAAIQKRADQLIAEKRSGTSTGVGHDMKGTHGGAQGLCPVYIPEGATATAVHQAKGVAVTITPKDKPADLATEITARIAKAADWVKANVKDADKGNQGGVGGGTGEDGSNHSGKGDGKGHERKAGSGGGGGMGTGGGGGKGSGGGSASKPR